MIPPATASAPWTEQVLDRFRDHYAQGCNPGSPVLGDDGAVYGTVRGISETGAGGIFKIKPIPGNATHWEEGVLYAFQGGRDGALPDGLIPGGNRSLYGTTLYGGDTSSDGCKPAGCGTVFKLVPPINGATRWTQTPIYTPRYSNGQLPMVLAVGPAGQLYGVAGQGGLNCTLSTTVVSFWCGTSFVLQPPVTPSAPWTEKTLYGFPGGDVGAFPVAGFIRGGAMFGLTSAGGGGTSIDQGFGIVFRFQLQ